MMTEKAHSVSEKRRAAEGRALPQPEAQGSCPGSLLKEGKVKEMDQIERGVGWGGASRGLVQHSISWAALPPSQGQSQGSEEDMLADHPHMSCRGLVRGNCTLVSPCPPHRPPAQAWAPRGG